MRADRVQERPFGLQGASSLVRAAAAVASPFRPALIAVAWALLILCLATQLQGL
jgi:hypothetical protein